MILKIKLQLPATGRDIFLHPRLLQAVSNLTLNASMDDTSITSLGNMCQGLTTLTGKNFFPYI